MTGRLSSSCADRSGNIFAMLFGGVALMGVLGVSMMNLVIGPATTVTKVTHQNMAENDLLMNAKVAVMNAATLANYGDSDNDGYVEPAPFVPTSEVSCAITLPEQGGCLPADIGAILTDPWGTQYAYCVWDHGETNSSANRINGEDSTSGAVLAVISAGPNKQFETPCNAYDGDPETNDTAITPNGIGDDLVQIYTYAAATAGSGGLWELKEGEPTTARIAKDIEVEGAFRMGTAGEDEGQVGLDSCTDMNHLGRMRFNPIDNAIEVCSFDDGYGWETIAAAGGSVPVGTIAAFDGESCPDNWEAVTGLQGRMVMGAGGGYVVGDTGGAATVALTIPQMPTHLHAIDPPSTNTSTDGSHTHQIPAATSGNPGSGTLLEGSGGTASSDEPTLSAGNHNHTVDIGVFASGTAGGGLPHENRPPYRVYLYCAYMGGGDGVLAESINDLTDIDTTGAQDSDILVWNEGAGQWLPERQWVKDDTDLFYEGGNVGIGTASPVAKLNVDGGDIVVGSSAAQGHFEARYTNSDSYKGSFGWNHLQLGNNGPNYVIAGRTAESGSLRFVVNNTNDFRHGATAHNGTEAMVISSTGGVGIGTNAPDSPLVVFGLDDGRALRIQNNEPDALSFMRFSAMRADSSSNNHADIGVHGEEGWLGIRVGSASSQLFPAKMPQMVVHQDGNVGIGTTEPTREDVLSKLTVVGDQDYGQISAISYNPRGDNSSENAGVLKVFGSRGSAAAPLTLQDNDRFGLILAQGSDGTGFPGSASIEFNVDGAVSEGSVPSGIGFYTTTQGNTIRHRRMTISSDGNVGIGATDPPNKLHVEGSVGATGWVGAGCETSCSSDGSHAIIYADGRIAITGIAYKPGGGAWSATSDIRLKDVHGPYAAGLREILSLNPIRFQYKEGNERREPTDREFIGLSAQAARRLMPELVSERDDGYLDLDPSALTYALINAVKELEGENDSLRSDLSDLEAANDNFRRELDELKAAICE